MPTFGSLFAGIGGIDLGLERAGWTGRWQVEWDPFCQHVLAHHWPDVPRVGDIRDAHAVERCPVADAQRQRPEGAQLLGKRFDVNNQPGNSGCPNCIEPVDLIAGGFPCQPFSFAGKQRGIEDERWLWPEFARVVGELRPRYVLVENVPGLLAGHGGMGYVLGDLARLGYDAEWDSVPAAAVGAPHLRYRVWIVAHDNGQRGRGGTPWGQDAADAWQPSRRAVVNANGEGRPVAEEGDPRGWVDGPWSTDHRAAAGPGWWDVEPDVGRVAHGVPARVDRLRALGNAVVPQVVEVIGRRLMEAMP
jgi:DNA (cytosine-5)-methyltransferase 1